MLIKQDLDNAVKLLGRKAEKLKDRIAYTRNLCSKIDKVGDELDGNTSNNDENEFIEAINDEMPSILGKLSEDEQQLDDILKKLAILEKSKNPDELVQIKSQFDDLVNSVDEHEDLANRLECEIIEWNA